MTREQLEHILRAASGLTNQGRFIVVGSQSIVGAIPNPPGALGFSAEADIYPLDAPDLAELIEGSIGEGSLFHETFGYYAQGVGPDTAVLPVGWELRLNQVRDPKTLADGFCLDPMDMAASKVVAWREKDQVFLAAMQRHGLLPMRVLRERVGALPAASLKLYALDQAILLDRIERIGLVPADLESQLMAIGEEPGSTRSDCGRFGERKPSG